MALQIQTLVGPGNGHNAIWQAKCREVGCKPKRCGRADMPRGRWKATCGGCGAMQHRHRQTRGTLFCRACGPERGKLVWQLADTGLLRLYWAVLGWARGRTNRNDMRTTLERIRAVAESEGESEPG